MLMSFCECQCSYLNEFIVAHFPHFVLLVFVRRSGDTGTGKSELLGLYSAVINSNCEVMPDLLFEVREALIATIMQSWDQHPAFARFFQLDNNGRRITMLNGIDEPPRLFQLLEDRVDWSNVSGLANRVR